MKIIAVGWNYKCHNNEMGMEQQPVNDPIVFIKAESSLLKDGKPFFLPSHLGRIEYEGELVVRIDRLGKNISPKFASRYYSEVTIGVDFTARELQSELRSKGAPWEISKSFDGAAVIGEFVSIEKLGGIQNLSFSLSVNDTLTQTASVQDMIHPIDQIIAYVSRFFTLKIGDLIFTGTPQGVSTAVINDSVEGVINGIHKVLSFNVK